MIKKTNGTNKKRLWLAPLLAVIAGFAALPFTAVQTARADSVTQNGITLEVEELANKKVKVSAAAAGLNFEHITISGFFDCYVNYGIMGTGGGYIHNPSKSGQYTLYAFGVGANILSFAPCAYLNLSGLTGNSVTFTLSEYFTFPNVIDENGMGMSVMYDYLSFVSGETYEIKRFFRA